MKVRSFPGVVQYGLVLGIIAAGCLEDPQSSGTDAETGGTRSSGGNSSGGRNSGGSSSGGARSGGDAGATSGGAGVEMGGSAGEAVAQGGSSAEAGAGGSTAESTGGVGGAQTGAGGEPGTAMGGSGATAGTDEPGAGGDAGSGGGETIEFPASNCPVSTVVDGWASVPGLGLEAPTTGGIGTPVVVTTDWELKAYAAEAAPYIILVSGTIAVPVLNVASNKTIRGIDSSAKIEGGIRIAGTSTEPGGMVSNVVIQNLTIDAATSDTSPDPDDDDGINISYAHHVWVDHVLLLNAMGDDLEIQHGSDFVTVSWSTFRFISHPRSVGARIGHSDANAAEDAGRLKVTMHHNWWSDAVNQRMPRVRFGDVHVYNNYYSARDNAYCIAAAYESRLLVENNYFDGSLYPHVFFSFTTEAAFAEPTAEMVATGNKYVGDSDLEGGKQSGQGPSFVPPYTYQLDPAEALLKSAVLRCTGPR